MISQAANHARTDQKRRIKDRIERGIHADLEESTGYYRKDPVISEIVTRTLRNSLEGRVDRSQIPKDCLFFSPKLTDDQRKRAVLALTTEDYKGQGGIQAVQDLYTELFSRTNPVPILVGDRYSVTAVPGYLQVPFTVEIADMKVFYEANKGEVAGRLADVTGT